MTLDRYHNHLLLQSRRRPASTLPTYEEARRDLQPQLLPLHGLELGARRCW